MVHNNVKRNQRGETIIHGKNLSSISRFPSDIELNRKGMLTCRPTVYGKCLECTKLSIAGEEKLEGAEIQYEESGKG